MTHALEASAKTAGRLRLYRTMSVKHVGLGAHLNCKGLFEWAAEAMKAEARLC